MKIALVILHADAARGGAERYTVDLAAALAARGHDVSMLASSFGELDARVRTVMLPAGGATRLGRYLRFLDSLDAHLAKVNYDVVHAMLPVRKCDLYHPHAGVAADAVQRGHQKYAGPARRAVAAVANRVNIKRRRFAAVERALVLADDGPVILCLSNYVRQTVRRHYPLPDARLPTLLNGADLEKFDSSLRPNAGREIRERFDIPADRVIALMIAQDFARKGLSEAIRATVVVNDPRLVLLVVGKDDPRPYQPLVDPRSQSKVVFAGSTDDPYRFYRAADFFVLPTRHDPCSLVVLEALAMGLPVISTAFNGACEAMQDGRQGFVLADPADVEALTATMKRLLDDATRTEMSRACLSLRPTLSYAHHLDRLMEIYSHSRR